MENKIYLVLKVLVIAFILSFYTFGKDKNLMLQYNFKDINKDKVSDISLNNNDGSLKDGALVLEENEIGKVLRLNGEGAYLELPKNLLKKVENYTVFTTVNIKELSNWIRIFDFGSSPSKYTFFSPTGGGGKLVWDTNDTTKIVSIGAPMTVPLNRWINLTCTYENGVSKIYFNGNEVAKLEGEEPTLKLLGNTQNNYIGKSQFSADPTIKADFSEIRIYNKALKKEEIDNLINNQINNDIVEIKEIKIEGKVGSNLILPKEVEAKTKKGKLVKLPVFWEEIDKKNLKKEGEFTVKGSIGGTLLNAIAKVKLKSKSLSKNYSIDINIESKTSEDNLKNIKVDFDVYKNSNEKSNLKFKVEFYEKSKLIKEISETKILDKMENEISINFKTSKEWDEKYYSIVAYVEEVENSKNIISEKEIKNIKPLEVLNEIEPQNVKITLDSLYGESQDLGLEYILHLDPDRLLAPCYEAVGKKPKAKRYGGWEAQQIAGHSLGHYISALSNFYASTKNNEVKEKLEYVLSELKNIQREDGYIGGLESKPFDEAFNGKVNAEAFSLNGYWVPWYSVHKIYAGLIDAYKIAGEEKALEIVKKMSDWCYFGSKNMSDKDFQKMLVSEHGGMCEVMADLYGITKDPKYLYLAKRFTQKSVIDPLSKGIDSLQGMHANTQIPKIIGAARLYELTGDDYYGNAAKFFFNTVVDHRSFVIGGNSVSEHFGPSDVENLAKDSCETCNTYNMLKLAEHLFSWEHNVKYSDYYEKALYNHILASQDPETGAKTYFVSTYPGHFKVYGTEENSFWCCTGTGMENPGRYNRFIYYAENNDLYINLFIASTGENKGLKWEQITKFPYEDTSVINILESTNEKRNIKIRVPYWINGKVTVKVGKEIYESSQNGYISVERIWEKGDKIEIKLPMNLHQYVSMDSPNKVAFLYGPIVLGAELGKEKFPSKDIIPNHLTLMNWAKIDVPTIVTDEINLDKVFKIEDLKKIKFTLPKEFTNGEEDIKLEPFYNVHHERYTIYFDRYAKDEFKNLEIVKSRDEILEPITTDVVKVGEQQSEIEHKFESKNSNTGYLSSIDMRWRDASKDGFIKYQMEIKENIKQGLMVTYYDKDKSIMGAERIFDIYVNGKKLKEVELKGNGKDKSIDVIYEIPKEYIKGNKIDVEFKGNSKTVFIGGILELRTIEMEVEGKK